MHSFMFLPKNTLKNLMEQSLYVTPGLVMSVHRVPDGLLGEILL